MIEVASDDVLSGDTAVSTAETVETPTVKNSSSSHCTDSRSVFNYNMSAAPKHSKILLLTSGKITVTGKLTGNGDLDSDIIAWYGLPVRNKEEEERLGL